MILACWIDTDAGMRLVRIHKGHCHVDATVALLHTKQTNKHTYTNTPTGPKKRRMRTQGLFLTSVANNNVCKKVSVRHDMCDVCALLSGPSSLSTGRVEVVALNKQQLFCRASKQLLSWRCLFLDWNGRRLSESLFSTRSTWYMYCTCTCTVAR